MNTPKYQSVLSQLALSHGDLAGFLLLLHSLPVGEHLKTSLGTLSKLDAVTFQFRCTDADVIDIVNIWTDETIDARDRYFSQI